MPKRQTELPGVEAPSIPDIENAADAYVKVRDRRMKMTEQEVTAKTKLLEACIKHEDELAENGDGDRVYRFEDEIVILKAGKRNVKVKLVRDDGEEGDED